MSSPTTSPSEADIKADLIKALTIAGAEVHRIQAGRRGKMHLGGKGIPDLFVLWGVGVWIEVKRPGESLSEDQKKVHKKLTDAGHCVLVVSSVESAMDQLCFMRSAFYDGKVRQA